MSLPKISRKLFIQASAVITGAVMVGCETEGPAGADGGGRTDAGRRDSGTTTRDSGPAGTDAGRTDSGTPTGDAGTCAADITGVFGNNHDDEPHTFVLTAAMLASTTAISVETAGTADHDHTIAISATDLATLRSGGVVRYNICPGFGPSNNHTLALSCTAVAAEEDPSC